MKNWIAIILGIGLAVLFALPGCSLIGFGIGAAADNRNSQRIDAWKVVDIGKNKPIKVYRKNAEPVTGRFAGSVKMNPLTDTAFSGILVRTYTGMEELPLADVSYVEIRTNRGKTLGFIGGLTIDALAIAMATQVGEWHLFEYQQRTSASSCPLIASYDGAQYRLDAEIFGGAIFKAAERPDWDNLDFLRETDGVYRLKMSNAFDETQEVDFIHLMVVDHPANSRVYPSYEGQLYTLSDPQTPRSVRDFAGADFKSQVRRNDDQFWLSNPFGRDPQNPADLRDGLILEFERSATASSAALLLNVQNTLWASDLQKKLLALPGRQLPQWYETLNNSPEARAELVRAMLREGMLRVYVWDDMQSTWRPGGHVWEVGSTVAKDVVLQLDLIGLHSNTLKVKLECPPGIWIVNSAQLDCSYSTIPTLAQTLTPLKATDQNGRDLLPLLEKADNRYYEMPTTQDEAILEFATPALRPGMQRSFILNGGGYYTIHVPTDTEPQMERLHYLLTEPGAFTRYALESLNQETNAVNKNVLQ